MGAGSISKIANNFMQINDAKYINALALLDNGRALDISQLTSLIKDSSFVVANDTGPAHIASHLKKNGLVLFGSHTTAKKVSLGNKSFKAISVEKLSNLNVNTVIGEIRDKLN